MVVSAFPLRQSAIMSSREHEEIRLRGGERGGERERGGGGTGLCIAGIVCIYVTKARADLSLVSQTIL